MIVLLWMAFILDLIFGDPEGILHPVQVIGFIINKLEKILLKMKNKILGGIILACIVIFITYFSMNLLVSFSNINYINIVIIYLMYTVFSLNSLAREGNRVYKILEKDDMEEARKSLSYLVSRDTEGMSKDKIIMSTLETISENITDGVVAPMFYMAIGGLPLAMTYKAINTLDSMVGYKNEKYIEFGRFSAKIDDIANFIPSRIGGVIVIIASFILRYDYKNAYKIFLRDRKKHSSPNSGQTEASVAGALGVQFGGEISYFGKIVVKNTIGDKNKEFEIYDIKKNIKILYLTSFLTLIFFTIILYLYNLYK